MKLLKGPISKKVMFFVSIFLSLYLTLFMYFEVFRFLKMRFSKINYENYHKLDKADNDNRVVISLSLTDKNISSIKPMLFSLIDQTVKVDNIVLNLANKTDEYILPSEYTNFLTVYDNLQSYGSLINILPTKRRERDQNTIIIYINNNHIVYGKDFIQTMVETSNKYPDSIITTNKDFCKSDAVLVRMQSFQKIEATEYSQTPSFFTCEWLKTKLTSNTTIKSINYFDNVMY